jgi:hypothetical protein
MAPNGTTGANDDTPGDSTTESDHPVQSDDPDAPNYIEPY